MLIEDNIFSPYKIKIRYVKLCYANLLNTPDKFEESFTESCATKMALF